MPKDLLTTAEIIKDSIYEHSRLITMKLNFPRFILPQVNTHRMIVKSYSSCLAGDTIVTIEKPSALKKGYKCKHTSMTIKEIVDKWFDGDTLGRTLKPRLQNMNLRCLNEDTGEFITTSIANCFKQGIQDIYEVTFENGYILKCTKNHRIFSDLGWTTLDKINLKSNDSGFLSWDNNVKFATNGFELTTDFIIEQKALGKTIKQISLENNLGYKHVCYFCEKNKIWFKKVNYENETFEYKNKEWVEIKLKEGLFYADIARICNSSIDKVKRTCRSLGIIGRNDPRRGSSPWNKGKSYHHTEEAVKNMREGFKKNIKVDSYKNYRTYDQQSIRFLGEIRRDLISEGKFTCALTGVKNYLHLHHIAPIWFDKSLAFEKTNIIPIEKTLHRKIHALNLDLEFMNYYREGKDLKEFFELHEELKITRDDILKPKSKGNSLIIAYHKIKSIKYLGEQETYDLEVSGKYKNFIANGIVVHNSRAQPTKSLLETDLFVPGIVGVNQPGMQASKFLHGTELFEFQHDWVELYKLISEEVTKIQKKYNVHKQTINRVIEPFTYTIGTLTATESAWKHLIWLRKDHASQPEFQELAVKIEDAIRESSPQVLQYGQWHLPWVNSIEAGDNLENVKISVSCNAQTSYRKNDNSPEKALSIFDKLNLESKDPNFPPHVSPSYHTAMACSLDNLESKNNKLHTEFGDKWIQYGKFLENGIEL